MGDNLERLQSAGIAVKTPLTEPYRSVVDELSEQEMAALISLKGRFDARTEVEAHGADTDPSPDEFFAVI
jgi:hypothetical protein